MSAAQPKARQRFPGLDPAALQHPYDRAALCCINHKVLLADYEIERILLRPDVVPCIRAVPLGDDHCLARRNGQQPGECGTRGMRCSCGLTRRGYRNAESNYENKRADPNETHLRTSRSGYAAPSSRSTDRRQDLAVPAGAGEAAGRNVQN